MYIYLNNIKFMIFTSRQSYIYIYIYILSIYVPSTPTYTHVVRLSLDLPYEKR